MSAVVDLWRAEHDRLVRQIERRHGLTRADAEDVVSEAFAALLEHGPVTAGALNRKAQSLAVDLWRRAYRSDLSLDAALAAGNADSLEAAVLRADLTRGIARLPEREREAFALTELRGLTEREAATSMATSYRTVRRLVQSARTLLREELA